MPRGKVSVQEKRPTLPRRVAPARPRSPEWEDAWSKLFDELKRRGRQYVDCAQGDRTKGDVTVKMIEDWTRKLSGDDDLDRRYWGYIITSHLHW